MVKSIKVWHIIDELKKKVPWFEWQDYKDWEVKFKRLDTTELKKFLETVPSHYYMRYYYWTDETVDIRTPWGRVKPREIGRGNLPEDESYVEGETIEDHLMQHLNEIPNETLYVIEIYFYHSDDPGAVTEKVITLYKLPGATVKEILADKLQRMKEIVRQF